MIERRELKRRRLVQHLNVYDRATERFLGKAVDLTTKGLLIMSEQPLAVGANLELRIDLPQSLFGGDHLDLDAQVVWRRKDAKPGVFVVGCSITSLSQRDQAVIGQLISSCALVE